MHKLQNTAQSAAHLTPVQEVASSSPTASRLTQPSIPPWVSKMSTWQISRTLVIVQLSEPWSGPTPYGSRGRSRI